MTCAPAINRQQSAPNNDYWGIKSWQEVSKVCVSVALALILAASITLVSGACTLGIAGGIIGLGLLIGITGWIKIPELTRATMVRFIKKLDFILENSEDVARVPEAICIPFKAEAPSCTPMTAMADAFGAFRGGVSSLRSLTQLGRLMSGETFDGDPSDIVFKLILAITRSMVVVNFLQRMRAISLPRAHADGLSFGVSIGFTVLGVMSFVNALRIWTFAKSDEGYTERFNALLDKYEKAGSNKTSSEINDEVVAETREKGHALGSEFLEAIITPLDTGACSHYGPVYVVVPLALLGGVSAAIRLWRANAS